MKSRICTVFAILALSAVAAVAHAEALRCGRFGNDPLPAPAPRSANWPLRRLATIEAAVKSEPYRVLFLGDSLVEHFHIGAGAPVWQAQIAPRGVLDAGVSGDRTEHLLWRLDNGNLAAPAPRAVIVLIGTNDLYYHRTSVQTADGVRQVLLKLRESLPKAHILLLGLWPRGEAADDPFRTEIAAVNRMIASCTDGRGVLYADIGNALLDRGGELSPAIAPDHLHPSEAGYARLAPRLAGLIDRLLGPPLSGGRPTATQ